MGRRQVSGEGRGRLTWKRAAAGRHSAAAAAAQRKRVACTRGGAAGDPAAAGAAAAAGVVVKGSGWRRVRRAHGGVCGEGWAVCGWLLASRVLLLPAPGPCCWLPVVAHHQTPTTSPACPA